MIKKIVIFPLILFILFLLFETDASQSWSAVSWRHPLGTDEFGRDILATVCISMLKSIFKAIILSSIAMFLGFLCAYTIVFFRSRTLSRLIDICALIIESIPLMLWVMVLIIVLPIPNIVLLLSFSIATLPFVTRVVVGEMERLKAQPFVEASLLVGASQWDCCWRHVLPNSVSVLAPLSIQLSGSAAGADGLFGLIGLGNRSNLNIGTLLLRSKENVLLHPELMIIAIVAMAIVFLYFWVLFSFLDPKSTIHRLFL